MTVAHRPGFPTPTKTSSGCKVGWYFYDTREDAEAAAKAAKAAAARMPGYDFGYTPIGTITETPSGFRVTVP